MKAWSKQHLKKDCTLARAINDLAKEHIPHIYIEAHEPPMFVHPPRAKRAFIPTDTFETYVWSICLGHDLDMFGTCLEHVSDMLRICL